MAGINRIDGNVLHPRPIKRKKGCQTPGCLGLGNINPRRNRHYTTKNCPLVNPVQFEQLTNVQNLERDDQDTKAKDKQSNIMSRNYDLRSKKKQPVTK
jgi:hypothetical protein